MTDYPQAPPPEVPRPPARRPRWGLRIALAVAAGVAVLIALAAIGAALGGGTTSTGGHAAAVATATTAPAAPPITPAPEPSPNGTYSGSCDYTLGSDPVGGFGQSTARAIGEVDLRNTGNIGTVTRVRITWPQEGTAPIVARKTVRVDAGGRAVARFRVRITGDQVDLLQSWQTRHGFRDGCTYHATITDTYGQVSG
jgi:hypothetical protein